MVPHNLDWMPLIVQLTSSLTSLAAAYSLESRAVTSATKTTDTTAYGVIRVPCFFIVFCDHIFKTWHGGISVAAERQLPCLMNFTRRVMHFFPNLSSTQYFDRSWPRLNIPLTVTCNIPSAGTVSQCKVVHPSIPGELHFSVPLMCLRYCIGITAMLPKWSQVSRDTSRDFLEESNIWWTASDF